jgi:hypothetical protein
MTTSWDCFDTLVTRRRLDPLSVFDDMGKKLGLDNFTVRRKAAEGRAPWTLHTIYAELAKDYQWTDSQSEYYKQEEINAELEHCCPIVENINRVEDGDLIVSDMYLPSEAVEAILRKNGLDRDVQVTVTTGGKSSGTIWSTLPHIDLHVGDNFHSDVASPTSVGIKGEHYTDVHLTPFEQSMGGDMALLMRVIRLACPYEKGSLMWHMWIDQAGLNIPTLILASLEIPPDNVAFVMRDSVHLKRIYEALHNTASTEFHCSRIALKSGGSAWKEYVETTAKGKLIVDLQGTGGSIINYWRQTFHEDPQLLYLTGTLRLGTLLAPCLHDAIERFNSSPLGSLAAYPDRKPCEFSEDVLNCQEKAVSSAIAHLPYFNFSPNIEVFRFLVEQMPHTTTFKENIHVDNHENVSNAE